MEEAEGPDLTGVIPAEEDTSSKEMRRPGKDHPAEAEMIATSIRETLEDSHIGMTGEGQHWEIIREGSKHKMSG